MPFKETVVVEKKVPVEVCVPKEVIRNIQVPVDVHHEKVKEIIKEVPVFNDVFFLLYLYNVYLKNY